MLFNISQKRCTKCGKTKSLDGFSLRKTGKYDSRCKVCAATAAREYYHNNAEKSRERHKLWLKQNAESQNEKARERSKKWRQDNPDRVAEHRRIFRPLSFADSIARLREWKKSNPDKIRANTQNRRARQRGNGGVVTAQEWQELKEKYNFTCLCCGRREPEIKLTLDHVKPSAMGGENTIKNAQPLCSICNSKKGAKWIDYR